MTPMDVDVSSAPVRGPAVRSVAGAKLSAVDLVTQELRRAILSGDLPAAEPFAVTELATRLGVSHVPLREALQRLQSQGLVVLNPAKRPVVAPLSVEDIEAIYDLRLRLEPPLAARSVEVRDRAWTEALRRAIKHSFDPDETPDEQWAGHQHFHQLLLEPTATAWEMRFLEQLWAAAERYTRLVFDPRDLVEPRIREPRSAAHYELLEVALTGTPAEVEAAVSAHLQHNLDSISKRVAKALRHKA